MPKNKPSQVKRWAAAAAAVREREEREADRIANDKTLDYGAKIDGIARVRGWFRGDTTLIDKYMKCELSVAEAVSLIAKPIDDAYSSADFGARYHTAEQVARSQRQYLSPEKALEIWGPEQDFPQLATGAEWDDAKSAGTLLWDLWNAFYHAAKRVPYGDETQQDKLVDLIRALKARPDPPMPVPMTAALSREYVWQTGTLWSDLHTFSLSSAEVINDTCGCGAGWLLLERQAWENVTALMARLTGQGIWDLHNLAGWQVLNFTERSPTPGAARLAPPSDEELNQHNIIVASLWVSLAADYLFGDYPKVRDARDIEVVDRILHLRDRKLPWTRSRYKYKNRARWETARREFARRRFECEANNEELSPSIRELALKASKAMEPLVKPEVKGVEEMVDC